MIFPVLSCYDDQRYKGCCGFHKSDESQTYWMNLWDDTLDTNPARVLREVRKYFKEAGTRVKPKVANLSEQNR